MSNLKEVHLNSGERVKGRKTKHSMTSKSTRFKSSNQKILIVNF